IKQALGDHKGARAAAREAVQIAQHGNVPRLVGLTSAYQARIWLAQGRLDPAARWADGYRQIGETEYLREFEDLTLARVLLAQGDPAEALALLDAHLSPARVAGRLSAVIEIQVLRALALTDLDEALAALGEALSLAEPEGYVRLFVDVGEPVRRLLKQAAARGIAPGYVGRLLSACGPAHGADVHALQPLVEP
ncbi:MAG: helix-turn-helix transcriptional regulator, partial [Anaerolineae bacterium]